MLSIITPCAMKTQIPERFVESARRTGHPVNVRNLAILLFLAFCNIFLLTHSPEECPAGEARQSSVVHSYPVQSNMAHGTLILRVAQNCLVHG